MAQNRRVGSLVASMLVLATGAVILWQRWNIYDWWRLRGYKPTPTIAQLASDTTMNDKTRRLFYVYHPELDDKQTFNNNCKITEQTIVLGCYVNGVGIYVYDVTDARLQGVLQVTAAHEMLHAAYTRLSDSDRKNVNAMIIQAYAKVSDQRIRDTIDDYRKSGADTTNELHSILATEVRSLPPELENYYKQYFANRLAIVSYSENYEKAFTDRKQQVAADDQKLASLKQQIDQGTFDLDAQDQALKDERAHLNALLAAKQYDAYNASVPDFNNKVAAYNAQVVHVRNLIDQYNTLVAERNAIALEEGELVKAIDSRPSTLQTQ